MTPRWLHWPTASAGPSFGSVILSVTSPGGSTNLTGQDAAVTGTQFSFSSGDDPYDTHGISGFYMTSSDRLIFMFNSSSDRTTFLGTYSAGSGFALTSTGSWSDQVVTFGSTANRNNNGLRYNVPSTSLTDFASDLASGSGFSIEVREPS